MRTREVMKVCLVLCCTATMVFAQTYIWTGNGLDDDWSNNENWDCLGNCFCFEGDCGYPDGTDDDAQIRVTTGADPEITITANETIDDLSIVRSVSFDTDTNGTVLTVDSLFITAVGAGAGGVTVTIPANANTLDIFAQGFDADCLGV